MAAFNYARLAATVATLLDRFGATCDVVRPTSSLTDADKPWKAEAAGTDETVMTGVKVLLATSFEDRKDISGTSGFLTVEDRGSAVMADASLLREGDLLVKPSGERVGILSLDPIEPGGVRVAWQLNLRT